MGDYPPEWLADSARFIRQLVEAEGDAVMPADDHGMRERQSPRKPDEAVPAPLETSEYSTDSPPQMIRVQEGEQTFQTSILFDGEPTVQEQPLPWDGKPPRREVDPVGIPDSMTCTIPDGAGVRATLLGRMEEEVSGCLKCALGQTRTNFVFGVGNPDAALMFIGEAPGRDEDVQGEPFVGRAGQLLNKIIESIGFVREDVYIGNILKCRPPGNRDPLPGEVEGCEPYLHRQIALIRPVVICALGRIAAQTLLRTKAPLGKLRGTVHRYQRRPLLVTYHPAALLRNPHWKKPTWEDVQLLRQIHDEEVGM